MVHVRRSAYILLGLSDGPASVLFALLGDSKAQDKIHWTAYSALSERSVAISDDIVETLKHIPSDRWTDAEELQSKNICTREELEQLADLGLLVIESPEGRQKVFAERDRQLSATAWHLLAAVYHFCTKWSDMLLPFSVPKNLAQANSARSRKHSIFSDFVSKHGVPPAHFVTRADALSRHALDVPSGSGDHPSALLEILQKRRTRRVFDSEQTISAEDFSRIIKYAFGPQGIYHVHEGTFGLGKTSPSGGGLHPTEVYPVVLNVEGLEPGIYHYNQEHHSLDLLRRLSAEEARVQANVFAAGQEYVKNAGALFVMTSRFYRNFWKYRQHPRAYPVLYMDIAHISQTFYLLCEELGLGAFFTAAVNACNIEKELKLDGFQEGALALLGCGIPASNQMGLEVDFDTFIPKR
ncbi:Nitroreductase family protein [Caballeronia calidae]|uniref:Nitroreductase family protein n=1 Tax=Caballeronia calidae TaxID=1777139 RepID=A0A158CJ53_9BURK|nr:putative peptide maturation dehydrogenase [Caballeronia calidae]SAK81547.1 Nitroreductase family protein [Caballeronia calidae]